MPFMFRIWLSFLVCLDVVLGHEKYQNAIPNGHGVPNPCNPGTIWEAVGHNLPDDGHHGKNRFGEDFKHHGDKHWTVSLCQRDSDGDGKTNGEELGDPDCTWHKGHNPAGKATGHPGICEPLESAVCSHHRYPCTGHH